MSESAPGISILLPCRDVARWLPECVASLEGQSLGDYEVLAVNHGSTDETGAILRDWSARDARVRVLDLESWSSGTGSPSGGGLVEALNLAAAAARAPLIARMDGDDVASRRRLEAQREYLSSRRDLAACGTGVEIFPAEEMAGGYERYERWLNDLSDPDDIERDLFVECPIAHPTLMIRRSVFRALGGYRDVGWPEDYDLVLRLFACGMRAGSLRDRLLRWRVRPNRYSLTSDRYSAAAFRQCKVHFLGLAFLSAGRPLVVWGAGRVGKPLARELVAEGLELAAFVDLDPRKIGQVIHGVPVLDPAGFETLLERENPFVLAAVGSPGARGEIREALAGLGRREIHDYRVCA